MMVVGWAVLALQGTGDTNVLEGGEEQDEERIKKWISTINPYTSSQP
jgi:uroporphyrin-III C-methyltransferase